MLLLLLDGHHSHIKNLEVAKLGKENGVIIVCFSPHCTHRMKPLGVFFMKPLSSCYTEQIKCFQRDGRQVQMKDIFSLFGKAWASAAKIETTVNSFKVTVPLNVNVFDKHFESLNKPCSSSEASNNKEANVDVQFRQVINKIMTQKSDEVSTAVEQELLSNEEIMEVTIEKQKEVYSEVQKEASTRVEHKVSTQASNTSNSEAPLAMNDSSQNLLESEVKIPLSLILKVEPLVSLLHNHIAVASKSSQTCKQTNENIIINRNPIENDQQKKVMRFYLKKFQLPVEKKLDGTATVVTSDDHIEKLIKEKAKKIKKEPKEKSTKAKSKPKIIENKKLEKRISIVKKQAPVKSKNRNPLATLNYQHAEQSIVMSVVQENIPVEPFQISNLNNIHANAA